MPQLRGPGQRGGEGDRRPRPDFGNESRPRDSVDDLLDEFGFGEERSGRLRGSAGGSRGPPRLMAPRFLDVGEEITGWRIGVFGNQWYTLAVGLNHTAYRGEIEELKRMIYIMLPSGLILLTLGGFWVSHSALRPIRRLTQEAQRVTAKGLDRRIPVGSADREFAELITVINDMLARLETSFTQATRFSSDAAHELKTPLTILQGELERMAQDTEAGSRQQERIFSLQDEVQRLSTILRKLLLLCQVDGGRLTLSTETINLSAWCEELAEDIQAFGPDLSIKSEIKPDVKLVADPDTLRQVMQNLVSNAVKYNEPNGWINLSLHADDKRIYFEIENAGLPIPERQRGKVFDRFYRVDAARSKVVEGSGLGLNLARELARAHGGDLELMDEGNAFRLTLLKNFGEA
jgi:signal transduction histidine kinase